MKSTVYLLGNVNYLTKNKSTILFSLIKALSFNERVILLFLNSLTTLPSEPSRLLHFQGDCQFFCVNKSFRLIDSLTVF